MGGIAAHMGAGEAETLTDQVSEQQSGLDVNRVLAAVDADSDPSDPGFGGRFR